MPLRWRADVLFLGACGAAAGAVFLYWRHRRGIQSAMAGRRRDGGQGIHGALGGAFKVGDIIGEGTSGVVRAGTHLGSGRDVAIKIIRRKNMDAYERRALANELDLLQRLRHPHVVSLIQAVDADDEVYIVMERLYGGELFDRIVKIGHYTEERARVTFRQIVEAVHYLHSQGVVHRDLKPENLLLATTGEDSSVKLCDFGIAKVLHTMDEAEGTKKRTLKRTMTRTGSPGYIAPEVLQGRPYDMACDMWSLGCVLYAMLVGKMPPAPHETEHALSDASGDWVEISGTARDLIRRLLQADSAKRGTAKDVLVDEWVVGEAPSHPLLAAQRSLQEHIADRRRQRASVLAVSFAAKLRRLQRIRSE